jgi:xanthine dehydrogenase FAD-binding subunit
MCPFQYLAPRSLEDVLQILGDKTQEVKVLAGGTDLLVQMKEGGLRPALVVDIAGLDQLRGIREEDGFVSIGPLTTHWDLAHSDIIRRHGLALAQGASRVGSPQIRRRGTIGGNVANASPAADTIPPLMVLSAEIQVTSGDGSRWEQVGSFLEGPSQTILEPQELITEVRFPLKNRRRRSQYEKFGSRNALSIAVASVAVAATEEEAGRLSEVKIALGSVSPTVVRASEAETLLEGKILETALVARAGASVGVACCPIDDIRGTIWYRRQLVAALLSRILQAWLGDG